MTFTPDSDLVHEHKRWLSAFDEQHNRNWEKLLKADPEAGMCEAAVRHLLENNGSNVAPNADVSGSRPSPDFRCTNYGKVFYVEVTHVSIKKATDVTTLPPQPVSTHDAQSYGNLNRTFFDALTSKTPQCTDLDAPAIVAVGTFHFQASCICFHRGHLEMLLTGDELITQKIDMTTGEPVGDLFLSTKLRSATFLRPDPSAGMSPARNPVSGMLLCGFGCVTPVVRGILHPRPVNVFDPILLPGVEFCRLKPDADSRSLSTEWIDI